jgi:hypothetical protein
MNVSCIFSRTSSLNGNNEDPRLPFDKYATAHCCDPILMLNLTKCEASSASASTQLQCGQLLSRPARSDCVGIHVLKSRKYCMPCRCSIALLNAGDPSKRSSPDVEDAQLWKVTLDQLCSPCGTQMVAPAQKWQELGRRNGLKQHMLKVSCRCRCPMPKLTKYQA